VISMESLLVYWIIINVVTLAFFFITCCDITFLRMFNPLDIYEDIKVNWIGAHLIAFLCNILFTVLAAIYWIYKLCTFGRD
jgi:hypothetical protein